jgi:hypothetical protein
MGAAICRHLLDLERVISSQQRFWIIRNGLKEPEDGVHELMLHIPLRIYRDVVFKHVNRVLGFLEGLRPFVSLDDDVRYALA